MKIDITKILIQALLKQKKIRTKITRLHNKSPDKYSSIKKISEDEDTNKTFAVISVESEDKLLDIFKDSFSDILRAIQQKIPFEEYKKDKTFVPSSLIETAALYRFFQILTNTDKPLTDYENEIFALLYHRENHSFLNKPMKNLATFIFENMPKTTVAEAYCGSNELYAYVYSTLLDIGISPEEFDAQKLGNRDFMALANRISETIKENRECIVNDTKERLQISWDGTKEEGHKDIYILYMAGLIIRGFAKLLEKKDKLLQQKPAVEIKTVVQEDTAARNLVQKKQQALNSLQIEYDRLKNKYSNIQEELKELKAFLRFQREAEAFEEKQTEDNQDSKPVIPYQDGIICFGGHPRWQAQFAAQYPHVRMIDEKTGKVDRQLVTNAKLVLINWKHISHGVAIPLMDILRENKIPYQYVW